MRSRRTDTSSSLPEATNRFLRALGEWVGGCLDRYATAESLDGHDQLTYTTSWEPWILARDEGSALDFLIRRRDAVRDHFIRTGQWFHGYWRAQEVHHGTEHFQLFLGYLSRISPDDPATDEQLIDAAEHLGNWIPGIPEWFDWDTGLFHGLYFGTDGVIGPAGEHLNMPDHFRCVNICLIAHEMTGDQAYLDLARLHAGRWADAILSADTLPPLLGETGGVYSFEQREDAEKDYRTVVGQAGRFDLEINRAENLLASDAVSAFLKLNGSVGNGRFKAAAERILDVTLGALNDPDVGPAAHAIRRYRRSTGDGRYDDGVVRAVDRLDPYGFSELALEPEPEKSERAQGIGKRSDIPHWYEDGEPRQCNPVLLALAAEIQGDERLATRAVDLGRTYLALARQVYADGREHGCSARTVSAVARGHGRANNTGVVTGVLGPVIEAFALG